MIDTTLPGTSFHFSSLRLLTHAAKRTFPTAIQVFREAWSFLLALQALQGIGNQFFTYALDHLRMTGREDLLLIGLIAGTELVFTLMWSALWLLAICSLLLKHETVIDTSIASRFNQLMIEQVRTLASVIWRLPLLFVPALVRYVRLAFVPFVVLLDSAYNRGEVDALQMSAKISRGHFWLLAMTLAGASVLPWLVEELAHGGGGRLFFHNPTGVSLGWLLTLSVNLLSSVFLLEIFRGLTAGSKARAEPERHTSC